MIGMFRAFAKSWVSTLLIGLLIISFGIWGVHDVFKVRTPNEVVSVADRHVGARDFKREFENYRKGLERQLNRQIPLDVAVENRLDLRVAEELATREAFAALLDKAGIRPSDALIKAQLEKIPDFFDQVSGRFDKSLYQQALARNELTPVKFEGLMRDEIAQQQVASGLVNGLRVPRAYSALGAVFMMESRDVGYFVLGPSAVPAPAPPTDAQLTAFMQENAAQLTRPEYRILTVVRFSPALVGANLPIDEAELKKRFEFRKDTLSQPETRDLVQIPAKDAKTAQTLSARLNAGEDPRTVARSAGVDAILYEGKPKSAVTDRKVAAAAFSMPPGPATVVQGDFGPAVVRVIKVTPGKAVTLDQLRPQLEAELRKDAAAEKVYALSQKYDDAHAAGSNLSEAAQKAGVPTMTLGPVSDRGVDPRGQPVGGLSQKLVEVAFKLPAGGESEVEDAGQGEYFAVRVERIIPKALPPLAEVRPQLAQVWRVRETAKRLQAKGEALADRLTKGESLEAVAASAGQRVSHAAALDRQNAGQNRTLSQDALGKAFSLAPGAAFTAENAGSFGLIVGKIEAVRAPPAADMARFTENSRPQMTMTLFRELGEDARKSARTRFKAQIFPDQARAALGLEPVTPKAAGKAP